MRFVNVLNRSEAQSVIYTLPINYYQRLKHAKQNIQKWKGLTLMKDPMSLSVYMMMLQEIKPKTILEFGTYDGGSALWMSDMMKALDYPCDIHTFDIDAEKVNLPPNSGVTFHQLDNHKIKNFVVWKDDLH